MLDGQRWRGAGLLAPMSVHLDTAAREWNRTAANLSNLVCKDVQHCKNHIWIHSCCTAWQLEGRAKQIMTWESHRKSKSSIRLERLEYPNLALRMTSLWLPCGCVSEFYAQEIWRDLWSADRCSGHLLTRSPRSASIQHQPHGLHGIVMPWVALSWRRSHAQPASDAFAQPQATTEEYCLLLVNQNIK